MLVAALAEVAPELLDDSAYTNRAIRLRSDAIASALTRALREARQRFGPALAGVTPAVNDDAVRGLKFSELLPPALAVAALAERNTDRFGAASVSARPVRDS